MLVRIHFPLSSGNGDTGGLFVGGIGVGGISVGGVSGIGVGGISVGGVSGIGGARVMFGVLGLPSPKRVLPEVMPSGAHSRLPVAFPAFLLLVLEHGVSSWLLTCEGSGTSLLICLAVAIKCL